MRIVAVLEAVGDESKINSAWERLIAEHPALSHTPPRKGINPFTKQPIEIPARPDFAIVMAGGRRIGFVEWDQTGERLLLVFSESDADADALVSVAHDVASRLGIPCNTEHTLVQLMKGR